MGRWLLGLLILLLVGLVYGLMTAQPRIDAMEGDIRAALQDAGHDWASVEMSGNLARVTGDAPSEAARADAIETATNTTCSACKNKHTWHNVADGITVKTAAVATPAVATTPTQSPYTFSARKLANGQVTLNGYVPSEADRTTLLTDAATIFAGEDLIVDDTVKVALGAPNNNWVMAIEEHLKELALLTEGRFEMDGLSGALTGVAPTTDVQDRVLQMIGNDLAEPYNIAANLRVAGGVTRQSGEVSSRAICQNLLNDLRTGRRIQFAGGSADIRGDVNFDLLNDIGGASKQCPSFRIAINGYTSSDGPDELNLRLSRDRANAVLAYLASEAGIERSRMTATGFGEANPIATNETAQGRERNRRIEFILSQSE